ncbi:C40 family peptidase [Kurthia sibirica]|uniref:Glycoside hydrolase n=1 Tax=Kurthia sibirica TaxID=202750 RepID=A0A2U3AG65_9BACL|nr:peptidoglycan endopeptidase [Kurthia sibirica]PWI23552.1 glycoside hydrolase [Kurthia sibirica]GEK35406.1 peptidoglycan endopeptidase LytF [Kurthia sibirica]
MKKKIVSAVALGSLVAASTLTSFSASAATYTVKSGDSLSKIGNKYGVSYKTVMNWNDLSKTTIFKGQKLQIKPTTKKATTVKKTTTSSNATYTVKSGDTLSKIGAKYGVSYKTIMSWNNLHSTVIAKGQKLSVKGAAKKTTTTSNGSKPLTSGSKYTVKSGDTLSKIASKYGVSYKTLMSWNGLKSTVITKGQTLSVKGKASVTTTTTKKASSSKSTASTSKYTVKRGDTLSKIASKYGVSYTTLMSWNGMKSTQIRVGQKLSVKGKAVGVSNSVVNKPTTTGSGSSRLANTASIGKQYLGVPYVWGGQSPNGFDCSGFITYVYNKAGISTPRYTAAGFYSVSTAVSNPQVGDLVFFKNTYKSGISHIGIYLGNGQMVSAAGNRVQIESVNSSYWKNHFAGYKRLNAAR